MGIVDDDGEILTGFDEFKTARYGVKGLDSLVDSGFIDAFGMGCADGSQRIVDIEQARDIHVEVDVDEGADDIKGGFLQFDFQVGPFEVGILFDTVGQTLQWQAWRISLDQGSSILTTAVLFSLTWSAAVRLWKSLALAAT